MHRTLLDLIKKRKEKKRKEKKGSPVPFARGI